MHSDVSSGQLYALDLPIQVCFGGESLSVPSEERTGLASGSEAAVVGDRHAKVFVGIDGSVVNANFVVQVRTGGTATFSYVADYVAPLYFLSCGYRKP